MATPAAIVFVGIALLTAGFQLALVLGAPWGEFTLGGRFRGPLPRRIRAIPVVSIVLLSGFAAVVAARARLGLPALQPTSYALSWVVVAYCGLGTLANALTPSRRERALWLPVVLVMLLCSTLVALE